MPQDQQAHPEPSSRIVAQQTTIAHIGPLPTPEDLDRYNQVLPGLAGRIVTMAEKEQAHRIDSEQKVLRALIISHHRGQLLATVLGLAAFTVAGAFGYWGEAAVGAGLAGGVILSIAGVLYVKQRYSKDQNQSQQKPPKEDQAEQLKMPL
ncbi:MAG: DUF2335 domain-containing protein [Gemmatimonadota bacterium]|nr:DUF2335 domain-containing protein [Gemmatimonadota bacterium]